MATKKKVKVKKKAKAKASKPGRKPQVGRTLKLSVAATWARVFNKQRTAKLDDTQIAAFMRKEFPKCKKYDEADVMLFRNRFNVGRLHEDIPAPKARCPQYENKKAIPLWGTRTKSKTKTVKKKTPQRRPVKAKKKTATKKKTTKKKKTKKKKTTTVKK